MEIVRVRCPQCKVELEVKNKLNVDQKIIKCPNCGNHVLVHFRNQPDNSSMTIEDNDSLTSSYGEQVSYRAAMSIYLYGIFNNGYTQYPYDSLSEEFKKIYAKSRAATQIVIHREVNLMYYCYIRKIDNNKYIGFSVVLTNKYLTQLNSLFSIFEGIIEDISYKGVILHIDRLGTVTTSLNRLSDISEEVVIQSKNIENRMIPLLKDSKQLPPVDYSVAKDSIKIFSVDDNKDEIIKSSYTFGYTYIYKERDFDSIQLTHYRSTVRRLNNANDNLNKECKQLRNKNLKLRHKQRNTLWVGILSVAVAILGGILYFKVINPSEVTHYETGEFVYYGPLKNGKPHGIGVAIYPEDDKDKRKYYYGQFENGIRSDTAAMLYYQDGNYFYGHIEDTHFVNGIQYVNSENSYFRGTFDNSSKPYNGTWYYYKEAYKLVDGK